MRRRSLLALLLAPAFTGPEPMPAAYPSTLPLALLDKTREQPAAFSISEPRRGWGYVEPTGTDVPAFWPLLWRFTTAQAQTFRQWFVFTIARGVNTFEMPIRTEFGLETFECQFLPEGLLPARQIGSDLWEYRATVMTRSIGAGETAPKPEDLTDSRMLVQQSRLGITPPSNARSYNAWPVACRLANGDILVGYTSTTGHHTSANAEAVIKRSTDNGATWGSEVIVYDHPSKWVAMYGISQVASGRVWASMWIDNAPSAGGLAALSAYSDDNGATWSTPVDLTATAGMDQAEAVGPVIEAPDGSLLRCIDGIDSGDTYLTDARTVVLRSVDAGASWSLRATVASPASYPGRIYVEPTLLRIGLRIYCYMRTGELTGNIYQSYSDDSGATWSAPASAFEMVSVPNVIAMESGLLVVAGRQEASGEGRGVMYASADNGATWVRSFLDDPGYDIVYAAVVDRLDGTCLVVYGSEITSGADADIDGAIAAPVASSYSPWGSKGSNISILDEFTARCVSGGGAALGVAAFSGTTKRQVEFTCVEGDAVQLLGIGTSSMGLTTYPGADNNGIAFALSDGNVYRNNSATTSFSTGSVGQSYQVVWNGDGTVSLYRNGSLLGQMASSLTGSWYPAWGPGSAGSLKRGVNLNTTGPFRYSISGAVPLE